MDEYCSGNSNEIFERFLFFRREGVDSKAVDDFVIGLKTVFNSSNSCQCMKDNLIRNQLLASVRNESTTKKLLFMRQLDLKTNIYICNSEEAIMN